MFCILHITDLHRAKRDPISNAELISALISDRDRYLFENPPISKPNAIVVSGDIIQGVGLGAEHFARELEAQYDAAYDFLVELTERFLDGDRSKVVIVPGNHDIDWNQAFSSMTKVEPKDAPRDFPGALHDQDSLYRWDWASRELYMVTDEEAYRQRFRPFWKFFERFYADASGLLRVEPWSDANLFSLDQGRIGVAAFNSCAGNDCFAFQGEIPKQVVARSHLDLKERGPWRLRIAVWHHDIEGPPHRSDYMDPDIVRGMIGRGFRLGLYGHQHKTQITPTHAYLPDRETMAIASAGSLCAGARELPTGARRGYSLIEIGDNYESARVHVREMTFANLFSRSNLAIFGGLSYVDLEWTTPVDAGGRPEDPKRQEQDLVFSAAEAALFVRGDAAEALRILRTIDSSAHQLGRQLLLRAARDLRDPKEMIRIVQEPTTIEELVLCSDAHLELGDFAKARQVLSTYEKLVMLPPDMLGELLKRIDLQQRVKS